MENTEERLVNETFRIAEDFENEKKRQRQESEAGQDATVDPPPTGGASSSTTTATTTTDTTSTQNKKRSADTSIEEIDPRVGDRPEIVNDEAQATPAADESMGSCTVITTESEGCYHIAADRPGSQPIEPRSEPSKAIETSTYNKPVDSVISIPHNKSTRVTSRPDQTAQ